MLELLGSPAFVAILALITSLVTLAGVILAHFRVRQLSINVDGRLTQLLTLTKVASHAEGVKDELARDKVGDLPANLTVAAETVQVVAATVVVAEKGESQ